MSVVSSSIFVAALACAASLFAEEVPRTEVGLRVGEHAPAFTLKDQNGKDVSLESLLKKGPVALVFYRSADWCLFCKFELQHLQRNLKQFEAAGGQVVGISYDSTAILKKFADRQAITFSLLSDAGSKTIEAYGVRDKNVSGPKAGIAAHVAFVIDEQGNVRAKLADVIYQEQPGVGFLLKALKEARSAEAAAGSKPTEKERVSSSSPESRDLPGCCQVTPGRTERRVANLLGTPMLDTPPRSSQ